jgi:phosphocarrier protein
MKSAPTTIINKLGLHARAATKLVNRATAFQSDINLVRGQRSVNAKSIMGVLTLAASMGTELVILADGPDEEEAVAALLELVNDRFGEEQ